MEFSPRSRESKRTNAELRGRCESSEIPGAFPGCGNRIETGEREKEEEAFGEMDSDQGKLFVGGISWETTEEKLRDHFQAYGEVAEIVVMKDRATGRGRGFGFVVFADPAVADRVVTEKHTIDGRTVRMHN